MTSVKKLDINNFSKDIFNLFRATVSCEIKESLEVPEAEAKEYNDYIRNLLRLRRKEKYKLFNNFYKFLDTDNYDYVYTKVKIYQKIEGMVAEYEVAIARYFLTNDFDGKYNPNEIDENSFFFVRFNGHLKKHVNVGRREECYSSSLINSSCKELITTINGTLDTFLYVFNNKNLNEFNH